MCLGDFKYKMLVLLVQTVPTIFTQYHVFFGKQVAPDQTCVVEREKTQISLYWLHFIITFRNTVNCK